MSKKPLVVWEAIESVVDLPGMPDGAAIPTLLLDERPSPGSWPGTEARLAARELVQRECVEEERMLILVGQRVANAFGLANREVGRAPVLLWWETRLWLNEATVCVVPEPSFAAHWYSDSANVEIIRNFLSGFFRRAEQVVLFGEESS